MRARPRGQSVHSPFRAMAVASGLLALLMISPRASLGETQPDDPVLKPDIPKFDLSAPKPRTLKGGVQHRVDAEQTPPPTGKKMSGGVMDVFKKKKKEKLSGQTARIAPDSTLRGNGSSNFLNSTIQSGVGIIGVKFLLPIGHMPVINRVFPGTPAWQVGLHAQDVIVAVDGVPTLGLSKEDVYSMIVGKPETDVTISIRRGTDFIAKTMKRMDFNDIPDPMVRQDYLMSI